jgi:hypothetical protein
LRAEVLAVLVAAHVPSECLEHVEWAGVARVCALVAAQAEVSEGVSLEEQHVASGSGLASLIGTSGPRLKGHAERISG